MSNRNLTSVLLLLILTSISFAACGSNGTEKTDRNSPTTPTLTPVAASSKPFQTELAAVDGSGPATLQAETDLQAAEVATAAPTVPTTATTVLATAVTIPEPTTPAVIQHPVQPGETLLGIAVDYGVSMAAIQLANGMGSSIDLIAGQTLSIPGSTQWLEENYFWVVHVVQAGETLVGLASAYDLTVEEVLRVNAIADPSLIHVDQRLVIPVTQLVTLKIPQRTATPIPAAAAVTTSSVHVAATSAEADNAPEITTTTEETPTPAPEQPPAPAPPPGPPAGPADWPAYILARINQARAERGLNTLSLVPELNYAAQAHAEDCASRGWGSHVGSDGAVLRTRLERVGYLGRHWGENWVQALNAERAFDWWYGEIPPNDPHRRNILSSYYTEIGIGITQTHWGYIFVTDFGRR